MAKIMLVEDDNNLREIYGARLMAEGYQIVSAADGEEALALAVKEKPDLIVADVMMPKISGFDMLDILRTTPETKNTKVIIMTALSQPEDRQRGEMLGADKYLVKSQVTLEDVVAAVHEILGDGPGGQTNYNETMPSAPPQPAYTIPPVYNQPTVQPGNVGLSAPAPEPTPPETSPEPTPITQTPDEVAPAALPPEPIMPVNNPVQSSTPLDSTQNQSLPTETISNITAPEQALTTEQANPADDLPKVPGASDAPEAASHQKKVLNPINNFDQQKDDLLRLAAEEMAKESPANNPSTNNAGSQETTPNLAQESIAQEQQELQSDIAQAVEQGGVVEQESQSPKVEADSGTSNTNPSPNKDQDYLHNISL